MILRAVLFFLFAVMLFSPDVAVDQDYVQVFERNRGWFLCLFALTSIADLMLTALRGDLLDPPFHLPLALHFSMLGFIGVLVSSRRFHVTLAGYVVGVGLTWSLVVRRFLES